MNRFVGVEWTIEFSCQETLMNFLSKWQGLLPLRHAGSRLPKNVSSDQENVLDSMGWNLLKGEP